MFIPLIVHSRWAKSFVKRHLRDELAPQKKATARKKNADSVTV
jgi:hypothetical protein